MKYGEVIGMARANNSQYLRVSSPKEARENGRKGGIASGESRRRKKRLKEALDELFATRASDKLKVAFKKQGFDIPEDLTNEQALALSMMARAISGDARMASLILDVTGDKELYRLRAEEIRLKDKLMTETKNEALETLDQILKGLKDEAVKAV